MKKEEIQTLQTELQETLNKIVASARRLMDKDGYELLFNTISIETNKLGNSIAKMEDKENDNEQD